MRWRSNIIRSTDDESDNDFDDNDPIDDSPGRIDRYEDTPDPDY